jgi:hypothetical protein
MIEQFSIVMFCTYSKNSLLKQKKGIHTCKENKENKFILLGSNISLNALLGICENSEDDFATMQIAPKTRKYQSLFRTEIWFVNIASLAPLTTMATVFADGIKCRIDVANTRSVMHTGIHHSIHSVKVSLRLTIVGIVVVKALRLRVVWIVIVKALRNRDQIHLDMNAEQNQNNRKPRSRTEHFLPLKLWNSSTGRTDLQC